MVQTHQVEVKGEACLASCPLIFQRDEDAVFPQTTPPHTPPSADTDTSNVLRKSSRIGSNTKRSYERMQSRRNGMPRKKFKYSVQEMPDISSTTDHTAVANGSINETSRDPTDVATRNESITKAVQPISNTVAATAVAESTDESANSEATTKAPAEIIQEPVNNATSAKPPTNSDLFDKPISNGAAAKATTDTTAMSANEHSNNATAPHSASKHTPRSEPSIKDCIETTTDSPLIKHTNVKRLVLNESSNSLEDVLEALKT
jgi:hypothetical protein